MATGKFFQGMGLTAALVFAACSAPTDEDGISSDALKKPKPSKIVTKADVALFAKKLSAKWLDRDFLSYLNGSKSSLSGTVSLKTPKLGSETIAFLVTSQDSAILSLSDNDPHHLSATLVYGIVKKSAWELSVLSKLVPQGMAGDVPLRSTDKVKLGTGGAVEEIDIQALPISMRNDKGFVTNATVSVTGSTAALTPQTLATLEQAGVFANLGSTHRDGTAPDIGIREAMHPAKPNNAQLTISYFATPCSDCFDSSLSDVVSFSQQLDPVLRLQGYQDASCKAVTTRTDAWCYWDFAFDTTYKFNAADLSKSTVAAKVTKNPAWKCECFSGN